MKVLVFQSIGGPRPAWLSQLEIAAVTTRSVDSVEACLAHLRDGSFDAIVMPDNGAQTMTALELLCTSTGSTAPVLVLGTSGGSRLFEAIRLGATDYADDVESLLHRLHARVAVHAREVRKTLRYADLVLDVDLGMAWRGSKACTLTRREFLLAYELVRAGGAAIGIQALSLRVWGCSSDISKRTIEQHVHRLRRKLFLDGTPGNRIQAIYGHGYKMDLQSAQAPVERRKRVAPAASPAGAWAAGPPVLPRERTERPERDMPTQYWVPEHPLGA